MAERPVTGTYRLQLHAGFTFADAQRAVPYLARLGVSHLYLSPVLQAAPGSTHGYDVVDHGSVSRELGGRSGLVDLADAAHAAGLGVLCDVVPNHMAIPEPEHLNRPFWELLRDGRDAPTASWFDVDWDLCGGRLGLPVLGDTVEAVLAAGELTLGERDGRQVVRYHGHAFPVAVGTEGDDVAAVLARQHYLLACWRHKAEVLGYRRFFDVDTLIAVRVEVPDVFDATHAVLLQLYADGVLDGFRVDHPDGLADPEGYLERLRDATGGGWVVVEKILEGDERLPRSWATDGTTGYDALNAISTALRPADGAALDELWRSVGGDASLQDVERAAKRQVLTTVLRPELERLVRITGAAARDAGLHLSPGAVRSALEELLVGIDVYRAYLRPGHPADPESLERLAAVADAATAARPDLAETVSAVAELLSDVDTSGAAGRDLVVRFQQVCGPVMAKGVEDTTFYRYNRLLALNEVGGDPGALTAGGPDRLHGWAEHQQGAFPLGLTALSTHDTKRSEDLRARLLALASDAARWRALWEPVRTLAARHAVDGPTAYLVFQTLLGAWPLSAERLHEYLVKAVREAKQHTSWTDPDDRYEQRVTDFAETCRTDPDLAAAYDAALVDFEPVITACSLAAKLLQLTLPGVPDVYQGCETVSLALVDPDNRRPVDYHHLDALLSTIVDHTGCDADPDGDGSLAATKLAVTARVLRLRRERPALFGPDADYAPVATTPGLLAFRRSGPGGAAVTVVSTFEPDDAPAVTVPSGRWHDVLSGSRHSGGDQDYRALLTSLPVALLVEEDE